MISDKLRTANYREQNTCWDCRFLIIIYDKKHHGGENHSVCGHPDIRSNAEREVLVEKDAVNLNGICNLHEGYIAK